MNGTVWMGGSIYGYGIYMVRRVRLGFTYDTVGVYP